MGGRDRSAKLPAEKVGVTWKLISNKRERRGKVGCGGARGKVTSSFFKPFLEFFLLLLFSH